jgi:hypothetical protein
MQGAVKRDSLLGLLGLIVGMAALRENELVNQLKHVHAALSVLGKSECAIGKISKPAHLKLGDR